MYDFSSLSPLDFEELVRDLLQAELGLSFESFGPGADQGIDFRCAVGAGLIVQAKHYGRSGSSALLSAIVAENVKVARLKPTPSRYILATSVSLSPALKDKIIVSMPNARLRTGDVIGLEDLNNLLRRHPSIEQAHFKLWLASTSILERIIRSGVHHRTETEIAVIRDMVPRFVQNSSVAEAEAILAKLGSLIIAGEPGVGKSTLARMLVWLHAAQGWRIFVVDDIADAFEVAHDGEKRLIFFDDFLGQVRLSDDFVRGIDQKLPHFLERVARNPNLRFVLTTRDYILNQAQLIGGRLATATIEAKRYVLDVGTYTRGSRARILYNHLHFSELPAEDRRALLDDDFYLSIIDHPNFNPRLIETLTKLDYAIVADEPIRDAVQRVLANPQLLWERPYHSHFSHDARAVMLALLLNERTVSLVCLEASFVCVAAALELTLPRADRSMRFRHALKELEGSVLAIAQRQARFSNPGVRDFLQNALRDDGALKSIVDKVTTYVEFRRCWEICRDGKDWQAHVAAHVWLKAFDRVCGDPQAMAWKVLELAIDVHEELDSEAALRRVVAARELFAASEFSHLEVDEARSSFDKAILNRLPMTELDALQNVITQKAAKLLETFGYALSLDDFEALDRALHEYGDNPNLAVCASRAGIDGLLKNLDEHLDDIGSPGDLDDFESELNRLLARRSVDSRAAAARIEVRRQRLLENEEEDSDNSYNPPQRQSEPNTLTDDQIRSMFGQLS